MAKFKFRLEALLVHRQQVEKEKQRRVAQIQQEIQALVRNIQEAQARISAENRTLGSKELTGTLDMTYIAAEKRFVGALQMKIALFMQKLAGFEQTMAAAREELLTAARARKVIEKLREKHWNRWRTDQERKEAAAMDEIGTQLAIRHSNIDSGSTL
ncbi:MAG TPA: flagellar export protein FliJ [Phycisphaerae bacterium]|jgi:flagellar FliJ protein